MNCEDIQRTVRQHRAEIDAFGVRSLSLFGSHARGDAGPDSDVDVLVEFEGSATYARYSGLRFLLEDLLGCKVDLVTRRGLRERIRPRVEREAIRVA
jgi:uncharacterized protein